VKTLLTERENEILKLVLEEFSSEIIAKQLSLSIRTVETHRKNIMRKTGCKSLIGVFKLAVKAGLVEGYHYKAVPVKTSHIPNTT
jgi:DNA-binding CsgD family transcriptional regulator